MTTKRTELTTPVPRRELDLFDEMDRAFDTLFHGGAFRPFRDLLPNWGRFGETPRVTTPRVDVIDRDDEILVRAEVPGVEKKDLHVDLAGHFLTIKGERHTEEETKDEDFFRSEITTGTFSRTVRLPEDVDFEKVKADFKEGMLEVHLPKTHKTERRRIKVE